MDIQIRGLAKNMKLRVSYIPETGETLTLDPKNEWVSTLIKEAFTSENPDPSSFSGELKLSRFEKQVQMNGEVDVVLKLNCHRCLEPIEYPYHVDIHADFLPLYASPHERKEAKDFEEEIELHQDDLAFNFYDHDEIDLSSMLRDALVLDLPIQVVCESNCPGLCPHCGLSLKNGACQCGDSKNVDPRWEALKNFKSSK